MSRENFAYLIGGFVLGILAGFVLYYGVKNEPALETAPAEQAQIQGPAGPMAPTQVGPDGGDGGAPMMGEIRALQQRVEEDPQDADALVRLGGLYMSIGMLDEAIGFFERAVEIIPNNPALLTDLGMCHRSKGEFQEALKLFVRASQANPDYWQALFNIVVVAGFDLGEMDVAHSAMAALERIQPQPPRLDELRHQLEKHAPGSSGSAGRS